MGLFDWLLTRAVVKQVLPDLCMRTLESRDVKSLVQDYTASKGQSRNLNPVLWEIGTLIFQAGARGFLGDQQSLLPTGACEAYCPQGLSPTVLSHQLPICDLPKEAHARQLLREQGS